MFTQSESKNRFTASSTPRRMLVSMRGAGPSGRGDANGNGTWQTAAGKQAHQAGPRTEPRQAEEWAGDCLFECYNG